MFFEQEHQKYTCPITGAHFEPKDLCRRLTLIKVEREKIEGVQLQDKNPAKIESKAYQETNSMQGRKNQ